MSEGGSACAPRRVWRIEEYRARRPADTRLTGGRRQGRPDTGQGVVSVITVCFNAVATLQRTIESVARQSYRAVEYIVIDGGSSDGTLDVLRSQETRIDVWISEKDRGISDAFNKGISMASGEFVMLVNADDWLEAEHLRIAVAALRARQGDYAYGNLVIHGAEGAVIGSYVGDGAYERTIRHIMPSINHPTVVCRREAYAKYGLYDTSLRCAMDYEWFLRAHVLGAQGIYVPELVSHMSMAGRSDRSFARSLAEVRTASIAYGYPSALAWPRFVFRLAKGYVRRGLEKVLPSRMYKGLRGAVNSSFRGDAS